MERINLVDILVLVIIILGIMLFSVVSCYINIRETKQDNIKSDYLQLEYL